MNHPTNRTKPSARRTAIANLLALCFGAGLLTVGATPAKAQVRLDTFDDGVIDSQFWHVYGDGGYSVDASSGKVEMTIPAGASVFPWASVECNFLFRGDFDVQVDYELIEYPAEEEMRAGIGACGDIDIFGATQRISTVGTREAYAGFSSWNSGWVVTTQLSGKLRLRREGLLMTSSYFDEVAGSWVDFCSYPTLTGDAVVDFAVSSKDHATEPVRVAFDNFRVSKGAFVPYLYGETVLDHLAELETYVDFETMMGEISGDLSARLNSKIKDAALALESGGPLSVTEAKSDLRSLVRLVRAQAGKKVSYQVADGIIGAANQIITLLGG